MPRYRAFGLDIESSLELPELTPGEGAPGAWIEEGDVPESLASPSLRGLRHEASATEALLQVDGIVRFHVADGSRLVFRREGRASDEDVRAFVLSVPLAVLLLQRGIVPLHASVVRVGDGCAAFLGHSGAGKSSLAAWFCERGHALLGDDICALVPGPDGAPRVLAGVPRLKLWADALRQIGRGTDGLPRVRAGLGKFTLPRESVDAGASWPLLHACVLAPAPVGEPSLQAVTGSRKLSLLLKHTLGAKFLPAIDRSAHFRACAAAARDAQVWRLLRPRRGDRPFAEAGRLAEQALLGAPVA